VVPKASGLRETGIAAPTLTQRLTPDSDVLECFCAENTQDVQHMAIE
jgi:hypothetical protein